MIEEGRGGAALWWAAMQQAPGVGAATMLRLARVFGSPEQAVNASAADLMARGGLSEEQAAHIASSVSGMAGLRRRLDLLARQGIAPRSLDEPAYPLGLRDLRSPPPLLYLRGELRAEDVRAVAVVGTREPDQAGRRLARKLAQGFAERGFTVVSGLARGIDTAAHRGALAARTGRTVAVLGSGLLRLYPPENGVLASKIARRGCLLSELPPDTEVDRRSLLARDRIQAALSQAVIVVQAHAECGSIVTARHAKRCGRLLLAVPWDTSPFREGWRKLRSMGADPVGPDTDLDELARRLDGGPEDNPQQALG